MSVMAIHRQLRNAKRAARINQRDMSIWVGVGAVGTVILGIVLIGEAASVTRMISVALIIAGIIGLKLSTACPLRKTKKSHQGKRTSCRRGGRGVRIELGLIVRSETLRSNAPR
jgi:hypothetical protein